MRRVLGAGVELLFPASWSAVNSRGVKADTPETAADPWLICARVARSDLLDQATTEMHTITTAKTRIGIFNGCQLRILSEKSYLPRFVEVDLTSWMIASLTGASRMQDEHRRAQREETGKKA